MAYCVNSYSNAVRNAITLKWSSTLKHVFAHLAKWACTVCYIEWPIHFKHGVKMVY